MSWWGGFFRVVGYTCPSVRSEAVKVNVLGLNALYLVGKVRTVRPQGVHLHRALPRIHLVDGDSPQEKIRRVREIRLHHRPLGVLILDHLGLTLMVNQQRKSQKVSDRVLLL